ncbi:Histone deacetylase [Entamoeba marina]
MSRVCYFYDHNVGEFDYGFGHPMKPLRNKLLHHLIMEYGIYKKLNIYKPWRATTEQLQMFHSKEYVDFLMKITPESAKLQHYQREIQEFNFTDDCPVFDGLYPFAQTVVGSSLGCAMKLNERSADICFNWSGGLHHAKKSQSSGFCYINDIVCAILELLKVHSRVLYIDIDHHHGDGVEEAFKSTNRVMTISLHKYGDNYFPGTGDVDEIGVDEGKNYSINVPLKDGINDDAYHKLYNPIIERAMEVFQPGAVVVQCGADSLNGDRLGFFNLSIQGHCECLKLVKSYNLPMIVVGGGGYTVSNTARCWCYETAAMCDLTIPERIPVNDYLEYYVPDMSITIPVNQQMKNCNSRSYCDDILNKVLMVLDEVGSSSLPTVQFASPPRRDEHTIELDIDEDQQDYNDVANGFIKDIPMDMEHEDVVKMYTEPLPIFPHSMFFNNNMDEIE